MLHIGFSLQSQYDRPLPQVAAMVKEAGFSSASPLWSPELDLAQLTAQLPARFLHAPHKGVCLMWQPENPESKAVQNHLLQCVADCNRFAIPYLVIHGWQGLDYTFSPESLDFRLFDRVVEYARQQGITIAFENLEGEEYLSALMERYKTEANVGFCWDSGHDHCYPHKQDFLLNYGHRLVMTHLNDNFGRRDPRGSYTTLDDLHFLPGDGNLDWEKALGRLANARRQELLNFEFKTRSHSADPRDLIYANMPLEQFLQEAATRAGKIAKAYEALVDNKKTP